MKKSILLYILSFVIAGIVQFNAQAQDTIVQWTFPTNDGIADGGVIASNLSRQIETAGGTSDIEFKNGATTKSARATGWDNGNDEKKWKVELETTGYGNLKLSSKLSSGGENPGPRDFKVQYKLDDGSWTDIADSDFQTANDWTTGVIRELDLPGECDNRSLIKLRWIMTSDTASDGSIVAESGISKIDDIFITGQILNSEEAFETMSEINIYPNPAINAIHFDIESAFLVKIYDLAGKQMVEKRFPGKGTIDIAHFRPGLYLVKIIDDETHSFTTRTIVKR